MSGQKPFVVLPFPQRRLDAAKRAVAGSTNGRGEPAEARSVQKRTRALRFFRDIHGTVYGSRHLMPGDYAVVVCVGASSRGERSRSVVR